MQLRRVRRVTAALVFAAGLLGTGAGCATADPGTAGTLRIVAAFYPLQFLSERIGGDQVVVTNLVKPGAEPHDLELAPREAAELSSADLVVYLHGFQPAVDSAVEAVAQDRVYDVAGVQPLRAAPPGTEQGKPDQPRGNAGKDPHVWLDPTRLDGIAGQLADRLAARDSAHAADYRARAAALHTELTALDQEYAAGLAHCQRREIITSHAAFGYLADRYGLTQVPITGLSPESEPTSARLADLTAFARAHGVTTIFFETLVSPKVAETLAREVGAQAKVLDPIEGVEAGSGADYLSVMRLNLATLRTALGCS